MADSPYQQLNHQQGDNQEDNSFLLPQPNENEEDLSAPPKKMIDAPYQELCSQGEIQEENLILFPAQSDEDLFKLFKDCMGSDLSTPSKGGAVDMPIYKKDSTNKESLVPEAVDFTLKILASQSKEPDIRFLQSEFSARNPSTSEGACSLDINRNRIGQNYSIEVKPVPTGARSSCEINRGVSRQGGGVEIKIVDERASSCWATDNKITTKSEIIVDIIGAREGQALEITMRNVCASTRDIPVKPCKKHFDITRFPLDYPHKNLMFYVNCDNKPKIIEDTHHPTLRIDSTDTLIKNGCLKVPVFIKCNNSCEKQFGWEWNMILTVLQRDPTVVEETYSTVIEETFKVRVCGLPSRDHKKVGGKKRKAESQPNAGQQTDLSQEEPWLLVKMRTKKDRDAIKHVIKGMGGEANVLPPSNSEDNKTDGDGLPVHEGRKMTSPRNSCEATEH